MENQRIKKPLHEAISGKHDSRRAEQTDCDWVKQYVRFHDIAHPCELTASPSAVPRLGWPGWAARLPHAPRSPQYCGKLTPNPYGIKGISPGSASRHAYRSQSSPSASRMTGARARGIKALSPAICRVL